MKVVRFLVFLYFIESMEAMVCKIEKNQVTDSQKAAWRSYLEPIVKTIQLLNQAVVISSAKDFPIGNKGTLKHRKYPTSFQGTLMQVHNEMLSYTLAIRKTFVEVLMAMGPLSKFIDKLINLFNDDEAQQALRVVIQAPKISAESVLTDVEDAVSVALNHVDSVRNLLVELANIEVTSGDDDILAECVKRFQMIVTLLRTINRFPSEFLFRVHQVRRRMNKAFEYVDKAIDANATGRLEVKQFLICSLFRVQQEMMFVDVMTGLYHNFCEKFGSAEYNPSEKARADYDGTLKEIDKKAAEAEERIEAIPQELTDAYNRAVDTRAKGVAQILENLR